MQHFVRYKKKYLKIHYVCLRILELNYENLSIGSSVTWNCFFFFHFKTEQNICMLQDEKTVHVALLLIKTRCRISIPRQNTYAHDIVFVCMRKLKKKTEIRKINLYVV